MSWFRNVSAAALWMAVGSASPTYATAFTTYSSSLEPGFHQKTCSTFRRHRLLLPLTQSRSQFIPSANTAIEMFPRGGAIASMVSTKEIFGTPNKLFNATLAALSLLTIAAKIFQRASFEQMNTAKGSTGVPINKKPARVQSIQARFLAVFWLLRASDWLQGPYFYEVYASKLIHGTQASFALVSRLFLTGFASTAAFGPYVGRAADQYGRKKATLAFTFLYALGAISTKSLLLQWLFVGRVLSGIGTSLLFSAPESWLVSEIQNSDADPDGRYLGETFGLAYAGDSIVAIVAGQMASFAASQRGATGAFELSTVFLALGGILTALVWGENTATRKESETMSIRQAISVVGKDTKIILVGAVQSLFEAAMYIFVLQWPPAVAKAVKHVFQGNVSVGVPYGTIFSCFMTCCLLGSTLFGQLARQNIPTETSTIGMLTAATIAMSMSTLSLFQHKPSLSLLVAGFFAFEMCVGMYFPSIGTLRSRYLPDSHRGVIMNLFGIPLNILVVSVFLSIHKLGVSGALSISSGALCLATVCMWNLHRITTETRKQRNPQVAT